MYAVVGSTGQVGGAVVRELRRQGCGVRALLRNGAKAEALKALGAEPFVTDFEDAAHVEIAFEGVEGVFFMLPPLLEAFDPRSENRMILAVAHHALQASHVPKIVLLSSIGAHLSAGTGLILKTHAMEQTLLPVDIPTAAIRAATFMDNLRPLLGHIRESGVWPTPLEKLDQPLGWVATEDIGKLAARLLTEPWDAKRTLELEGPRPYSMREAAAIVGQALGRPVEAQTIPREGRVPMFEQFGMSAASAADMVEMMDGFDAGTLAFEGGENIEQVRGETTLEQWLDGTLRNG